MHYEDLDILHFRESDQIVALKAQLGYLKSKLARECPNVDINANDDSQPTIYAVTPTYARPVQKVSANSCLLKIRICTFGSILH